MDSHIRPVELTKAYRLINHGPTVLVSAQSEGVVNVMAAAWCCALDFDPPKLTVVLDVGSHTRSLIEASGSFVVQVPTVAQLDMTQAVGNSSMHDDPNKLAAANLHLFEMADSDQPFVAGCSAWLSCSLIEESQNQTKYDLMIGEITSAWADDRVFREGRWHFEDADPKWRSLHHVAGGHFYAIGEPLVAK
jgi:flavin reductase (DIM6/NTAB) family NADH-FMN oxidoreductase RutF